MGYGDGFLGNTGSGDGGNGGGGGSDVLTSAQLALLNGALQETTFTEVASQTALDAISTGQSSALVKITTAFGDYDVGDLLIYDDDSDGWEIIYRLNVIDAEDDFPDVSTPAEAEEHYRKTVSIRRDTLYILEQVDTPSADAAGDWDEFTHANYLGVRTNDPSPVASNNNKFYYSFSEHSFRAFLPDSNNFFRWLNVNLSQAISDTTAVFLGDFAGQQYATNAIQNFSNSNSYHALFSNGVKVLENSTYSAHTAGTSTWHWVNPFARLANGIYQGTWNGSVTFKQAGLVLVPDKGFAISLVDDNLNNDPTSDDGSNWFNLWEETTLTEVSSQAELESVSVLNRTAVVKITADFSVGTTDYADGEIWIWDNADEVWKKLIDPISSSTSQGTQYHRTYERQYRSGTTRNSSNQITINLHSGDEYNVDISRHTGAQALPESYLNSLPVDTEVRIADGDVVWEGYLVSVHDDDETTATLRIAFGERQGTFTDGETVEISFGYSPATRQTAAETPVDATGFDGNLADTDDTAQKVAQKVDDLRVQRSQVTSLNELNALTTANRIAIAHVTTAFSTYQVNDVLIYDSEDDAWELLVDASDYTIASGISSVRQTNVASQTALDAVPTDGRVAIAKVTTAFGTYQVNDILIYDSVVNSWTVLVDGSDYSGSGTATSLTEDQAQDRDDTTEGLISPEILNAVVEDRLGVPLYQVLTPADGDITVPPSGTLTLDRTSSGFREISNIAKLLDRYAEDDIKIRAVLKATVGVPLNTLSDHTTFRANFIGNTADTHLFAQNGDTEIDWEEEIEFTDTFTSIEWDYGVTGAQAVTISDLTLELFVISTLEDSDSYAEGIQRSNVASQTALDGLATDDRIAIAKVTTAFGSYQVNDILIYDTVADGWEILVDASDYSTSAASVERSDVASQAELTALTTTGRVAVAKVTTAFGSYAVNDILIYDSVASAWEVLVDASDYQEGLRNVERFSVTSQAALNSIVVTDKVSLASVATAFGSYEDGDVLIYDTVNSQWELLVDRSDFSTPSINVERSDVANQLTLDGLSTSGVVALARVTAAFGSYTVNDILIYDTVSDVWEVLVDATGAPVNFKQLSDTPDTITEGRYLRGNADNGLEEVDAAPVNTERVILFQDADTRNESNGTFFSVTLSRAPVAGRLLDVELFFDGFQAGTGSDDELQDRWNTVIPFLIEADDFLSRPTHTSANDPTGSIPFKTTRDIQLINGGAGFSHTTIYIAKGNDAGTVLRVGSPHLGTLGSMALRVVEYIQHAPVSDGTETNLEEGARTEDSVEVTSSTGDNATLQAASDTFAGVMTAAHKVKVDRLGTVQRSEVATQAALDALATTDQVAIAKVTTAFGSYQVNDILIYDSEDDTWEVLVDASDYSAGATGIQRSDVASITALNALITTGRVAIAKVATAFGVHAVNDILIYDTVSSSWETLVDASDYSTSAASVERSDVASQAELTALTTTGRVAVARVTTAFGSHQVNDILIYDSVASAWETLVDASDYAGTAEGTQYHRTYERQYRSGTTRNSSNQITINLHSGDEYNVDISRHTGAQALPESYLNSLPVDTEVRIADGDVVWEGYLVSVHDDDETTATLRIAFGERQGTFTDGETVEISFGYSPATRQTAAETPVDATGFDGNLADTDDTAQKVAQKVDDLDLGADGSSRGDLIATSSALPTTGIGNAAVAGVSWANESDAPTGFAPVTGATTSYGVPREKPFDRVNGIWVVTESGGTEVGEVFIPWGGGGATTDDATGQYSIYTIGFSDAILAEIQYHIAATATPRFTLYGKGVDFAANSVVKLYFGVSGGGSQGEPGDSHVPVPTADDVGETLAVNADGDLELTAFAGRTQLANGDVDDIGSLNDNRYRGIDLNRNLGGLAGFDLQIELISTATGVNVRTFSPIFPVEAWLALDTIDLNSVSERENPVRAAIQLHVQRIHNAATGSFGWSDLGLHIGRVANDEMAFATINVNNASVQTVNIWLIPRTGVNE